MVDLNCSDRSFRFNGRGDLRETLHESVVMDSSLVCRHDPFGRNGTGFNDYHGGPAGCTPAIMLDRSGGDGPVGLDQEGGERRHDDPVFEDEAF
jgi:hypothetical protein